ncbi:hypothetical protein ES332_A05G181100v1 [Gossypium tomentosum]|uniref:Uncharacterized protein n=1 Tax=Gossypium tomentosum TaxID=34277 RepID=A0A5D2QJJ4_GOSTO|nr:hypothetical protein ES332_A05G181100v1 [Gossypium tomentosum]
MEINKLEQLRKSICDIEIERIRFKLFSNQKEKLLELVKLFRSKVYHTGINRSYDSLIKKKREKKGQRNFCAFFSPKCF